MKKLRLLVISAVSIAAVSIFASQASAGSGLIITLQNQITASTGDSNYPQVRMVAAGGEDCWYVNDLLPSDSRIANRGQSTSIYTEHKSSETCLTTYEGTRGVALQIRPTASSGWLTLDGGAMTIRFDKQSEKCRWDSTLAYCFQFKKNLPTWGSYKFLPGLVCWTYDRFEADSTSLRQQTSRVTITVRSDEACNTPRGTTVFPSSNGTARFYDYQGKTPQLLKTTRPLLGDTPKPSGSEAIFSLLSSSALLCDWFSIMKADDCKQVADGSKSDFDNVTVDVKEFKITESFGDATNRKLIATSSVVNRGPGEADVAIKKDVEIEQSSEVETTKGWSWGSEQSIKTKFTYDVKIFGAETEWEAGFSEEFSIDTSEKKGTSKKEGISIDFSAAAPEGYKTQLDVFTQSANANYKFEGDITIGIDGKAENFTSPAAVVLGMSPSTYHQCAAYVMGGPTVAGSIMNRLKTLLDAGFSASDSSLPRERRLLLQSSQAFSVKSGTPCPGFPKTFPSVASFKGTGVGSFESTGYGPDGKPLKQFIACVYRFPLSKTAEVEFARSVAKSSNSDPCLAVENGDKIDEKTAGVLVDMNLDDDRSHSGSPASERVLGSSANDTIRTGAGVFEIIHGYGGNDIIDVGTGRDVAYGGIGNDLLRGRGINNLYGGSGNDTLIQIRGTGILSGGSGNDVLEARSARGQLAGGKGNDTYRIVGGGPMPTIFEMPGEGTDTIFTERSMNIPTDIETIRATGGRAVRLVAGYGSQTIIGNNADNILDGGEDGDIIDGRGGNDTIYLGWDAHDFVRGGSGADRFIPQGTPAIARGVGIATGAKAHRILDFDENEGDRIVLKPKVFGKEVRALRNAFNVETGRNPLPKTAAPTLLLNTVSGVIAFDRDGTGPIMPKVVVQLPWATSLTSSMFVIR